MFSDPQIGGHPDSKLLAPSQPDKWPQDAKTFEFEIFGSQTSNSKVLTSWRQTSKLQGHPKSELLASNQLDTWSKNVKTFEFDVFGNKNFKFEDFNVLGHAPR